ncbi:two component transcriptional regulator, LuxR family [Sphingobium faniae]|nr:two component transcriptional regulator, LuxR family [Sphingobium faniae]
MAKLIIVDDHPIFLDGLTQFLGSNGHDVLGGARTEPEALELIANSDPEILVLDLSMKEGGGLYILGELRASGCSVPAIFLTVYISPAQTLAAIEMGVNGIVLKESDPQELLACIAKVAAGENCIDPDIMDKALRYSIQARDKKLKPTSPLTEREKEISQLIRTGLRNRAIAEKCGLTEGTVKVHLHSIFQKLGVRSRAELIVSMIPDDTE